MTALNAKNRTQTQHTTHDRNALIDVGYRPQLDLTSWPSSGYVRQSQLIGQTAVTPEQAQANRRRGKGPVRPRPGQAGVIPWSPATLWRKIASKEFVAPVKLSEGVTAWPVEAVRAWLQAKQQA